MKFESNELKKKCLVYIFMTATWIIFQFNALLKYALRTMFKYVPDTYLGFGTKQHSAPETKIVLAQNYKEGNPVNITNALKLFMQFYWDKEMCDDNGGFSLIQLRELFGEKNLGIMWVCYRFYSDLNYLFIDFANEIVYRYNDGNKPYEHKTQPDEVLFNQVSFNPDVKWD